MKLPADRPVVFFKAHVKGYTRGDGVTVAPHERIIRHMTREQAHQALGDAWWGGKNKNSKRIDHDYTGNDDGSGWVEAHVPLDKVRPNEAGGLYDGTADPKRVAEYVGQKIETPVHLLFGERAARLGGKHAAVMDGGHRVSAARKRGDESIRAIMQRSHYDRLMASDRQDLDPAKVFGQMVAPLAIQAYNKLGSKARDAVDHWGVNWSTGRLEMSVRENNEIANEINAAFEPVRKKLREVYGETVPAFRGEHDWGGEAEPDVEVRALLSWSPIKRIAVNYALNSLHGEPKRITDEQISDAVAKYESTGYVKFRGNHYIKTKEDPSYFNIFDRDRQHVTDGDDLSEILRDDQRYIDERIASMKENSATYFAEIPVSDIVWVPVGVNLKQPEFISKYNPRKREALLVKASSIPEGARWITVHPGGPGSDGTPVLIQPQADGSAHVIGGAGGKLNYLRLRHVRKESEYKKEAEERKKSKKEEAKAQRQRDKEAGILESKNKAKQDLRAQQHQHEREFVRTVADSMGWDPKQLEFPEQDYANLSEAAQAKLRNQHHRTILQRATQAVDMQRQRLVADNASRMEAGIGEVPLESKDPETLSVQDLNPIPSNPGGLGFSQDFRGRAEAAGLTDADLRTEADQAKAAKQSTMTDAQRQAAVQRGETAKMVKEELKGIREPAAPDAKATLTDTKKAVEMLKAAKRLKQVQQKAREQAAAIDKSAAEPKAFVLEYTASPDDDAKLAEDLNNDLRTAQTQSFLSEFRHLGGERPEETLGKHIGVGAYNSINSLALAVGGDALVDRSVVDVLGIAGAAQVLARRIHKDLPDDAERITEGVQEFHLHHYMETSHEALGQARELMEAAKEIEIGDAANGADLQVAQELNATRRKAVNDAQKILGQALGEMEANAALTVAMKQGAKDRWQGSLGKIGIESAIQRVRAIGLQRGDYTLENVAGDTFLTINADGLDRLAKPVNRADVEQVKRNLSIIRGDQDEDGWLPLGVANRPDLAMEVKPGVAPRLAEPFQDPQADGSEAMAQSIKDYIGGRTADGDTPADIYADLLSLDMMQKVGGRREEYMRSLDAIAPTSDERGKIVRAESRADYFNELADAFVKQRYGGERSALNSQKFTVDQKSVDALHRALSEHPDGVAAFKQIGEMTNQDQRTLREFFYRNVAKENTEQAAQRTEIERLDASEPERETTDMFGETTTNPEWQDWRQQRDETAAKMKSAGLDWSRYTDVMHGHEKAYEAIQDMIRSNVGRSFAESHNRLNPRNPIKVGKAVIRNNLNHLDAVDPTAREERMARERELVDSLRERVQGKYASGAVSDKLDATRQEQEAFEQAQMGFFGADEAPASEAGTPKLAGDERHTLGHAAERQLAGMMGIVGKNFKPGQPTRLWAPTMSGGKNAARQRLVKLIDANKRVVAAFGTGSGKSLLGLASFTHLHQQGKAKRGLFLVPSIVQGQFSGEALRYLEPGKFNWHIQPGASREERIAAYKDPYKHFAVMTHQSFRDDMMHLGAKHAGISEAEMASRLGAMSDNERKDWIRGVHDREGIKFDYLNVDEGQNVLNRAGKENSAMANVVDAMSHPDNTPYYVSASADPVKNDASEIFDLLRKMEPSRYTDRGAFMRRYGADTLASKDALKREMARYVYPSKIDPNTSAERKESRVALSVGQRKALDELDGNFTRARLARMQGEVDVAAMKAISPNSFDGVPDADHEAVAKDLQRSLGIMKSSAIMRVINNHPDNPLLDDIVTKAAERSGKPGIVFAHSLEQVKTISDRLAKAGHRVVTITGADSGKEKERKRLMFRPEQGEAQADILVASDAGSTGLNAQRGQWVYQADTPQTALTHAQRNARAYRTGVQHDVEMIDGVVDHPEVHRARERLTKKYGLRELMQSPMDGLDDTGVAHFLKKKQVIENDSHDSLF